MDHYQLHPKTLRAWGSKRPGETNIIFPFTKKGVKIAILAPADKMEYILKKHNVLQKSQHGHVKTKVKSILFSVLKRANGLMNMW